ncbi:MAG: FAD:protein FMN transferase [Gammaproteobacteria bacterium]
MRALLGTFVEAGADGAAGPALAAAFARIEQAQALWSFQDPDSELSRLNRAEGAAVTVSPLTCRLLRAARAMTRASAGLFDCTVGGALVAAGALPDHGGAPSLPRGHADDIVIGHNWARLARPLRITLDGIAKGFAIDLALCAMRHAGAQAGWINAGGDVAVFGERALPMARRGVDGKLEPLGGLRNAAMASSRTGAPDPDFPARMVGREGDAIAPGVWTVLARSAWRADALTKVAALAPSAERAERVRRLGGALIESSPLVQEEAFA